MKLSKSVEEYEANKGWSSSMFYVPTLAFLKELKKEGVKVEVGRTVIYIADKLKCYVHHNGRSNEYATITDFSGNELFSAHYKEFDSLKKFIREQL